MDTWSVASLMSKENLARRAELLDHVAELLARGEYARAWELSGQAWQAWRHDPGEDTPESWGMAIRFAEACYRTGRYAAMGFLHEDMHRVLETTELGTDPRRWVSLIDRQATHARTQGSFQEELALSEEAVRRCREILAEDHEETLRLRHNLASTLRLLGQFAEAYRIDTANIATCEQRFGRHHPATYGARNARAMDLREVGCYAEAISGQRDALADQQKYLGVDHPKTLGAQRQLAVALLRAGDATEALDLAVDCHQRTRQHDHRGLDVATTLMTISACQRQLGRLDQATDTGEHATERMRDVVGGDHPFTLVAEGTWAAAVGQSGLHGRARRMTEQVVQHSAALLGAGHPQIAIYLRNLGTHTAALGDLDTARQHCEEAAARAATALGAEHPVTLAVRQEVETEPVLLDWDTMQL